MNPTAKLFESFDVAQVIQSLPSLARPFVQDFLRQNRIVLGHLFETRDIPTPGCGTWSGEFTILATQPHVMIGIYHWRNGAIATNIETTYAASRLLTGPADACVAAMVSDFHRFLSGKLDKP